MGKRKPSPQLATYRVELRVTYRGHLDVEAKSAEEAKEIAEGQASNIFVDEIPEMVDCLVRGARIIR